MGGICRDNPIKTSEAVMCTESTIVTCDYSEIRDSDCDREVCPSRKSAEAHLAMIQLEQLRDCYNNSCNDTNRIAIINNNGNIELYVNPPFNCFLTFKIIC